MDLLDLRLEQTNAKLVLLQEALRSSGTFELLGDHACIYATGSVGRGESGRFSDLDVFILGDRESSLSNLNSYLIRADLIRGSRNSGFPDFSGDGEWLDVYYVANMLDTIGSRADDWYNTFTARVLMLLEGRCIAGEPYYNQALERVVRAYWRDYAAFANKFAPFFLLNDITKYWKVLCLEYAHKTAVAGSQAATVMDKAHRRLSRFKLHHSRVLICFATIVAIGYAWRKARGTINADAMLAICSRTPLQRLTDIATSETSSPILAVIVPSLINDLLQRYREFLEITDAEKGLLLEKFSDHKYSREKTRQSMAFRKQMYQLVRDVLGDTEVFQYVVM